MTALHIIQVEISDSSNKTIRGIWEFDHANGGHLLLPSGSVLPTTGTYAGEVFYNSTTNAFYVRNGDNTAWDETTTPSALSASFATSASFSLTASYVPGYVSQAEHPSLRQLIHLANSGPFEGFASGATLEIGPQPFYTASIWRGADTLKIVEKLITRNDSQMPTIIQWKAYDTDGVTVLATVTDTISYNGAFESARTRSVV